MSGGRLPLGRHRRDVDDPGPLGLTQERQRGPDGADRAQRRGRRRRRCQSSSRVGLEALEAARQGAGGVHDGVEVAPALAELGDGGLDRGAVEQVGGEADGVGRPEVRERRRRLVEVVTGAGQHGDAGAIGGEAVGGRPAHAGGAAGDDDGGSGESEIHVMRSCGRRVVRSGDRSRPWPRTGRCRTRTARAARRGRCRTARACSRGCPACRPGSPPTRPASGRRPRR